MADLPYLFLFGSIINVGVARPEGRATPNIFNKGKIKVEHKDNSNYNEATTHHRKGIVMLYER